MDVCCVHYEDSTKDKSLQSLSSIESWIMLLETAKFRNDFNIINIAADLEDGEVPKLKSQELQSTIYLEEGFG